MLTFSLLFSAITLVTKFPTVSSIDTQMHTQISTQSSGSSIDIYGTMNVPRSLHESLRKVQASFIQGEGPCLTEEGTSGSYVLKDVCADDLSGSLNKPVAVWKPIDEEPFAPNNPRGMQAPFGSETCRPGVKSGESSIREVLAYMLDHEGFAGVPETALVEVSHPSLNMERLSEG